MNTGIQKIASKYIGIKYKDKGGTQSGIDCYGLVRLFYKDEFNIELPDYRSFYSSSTDQESVSNAVLTKRSQVLEEVEVPEFGDIIIFNIKGYPVHVGIYLEKGDFLHSLSGRDSCIENLRSLTWSRRVDSIWRYK